MADRGKNSSGDSSSRNVAPSSRTNAPGGSSRARRGRVPEAEAPPRRRGLLPRPTPRPTPARESSKVAKSSSTDDRATGSDVGTSEDEPAGGAAPGDRSTAKKYAYGGGALVLVFLGAQILSSIAYAIVQSSTSYDFTVPAGVGSAVGQASSQFGQNIPFAIGVPPPMWLTALMQLPLWLCLGGMPIWFAVKKGRGVVADLGLRMKAIDVPIGLAIGVACQLLLVPLIYLILRPLLGINDVSAAARELTDRATDPLSILLVFLIVGIGAPIAEEIYFRGMAQRIFGRRLRPRWAILAAAAFFAATHLQPLQFPALLVFGVILGVLAWRSGRLGPSIWAHLGFNVVAAVGLVFHIGPT